MSKFVKCDHCDSLIPLGSDVYTFDGFCGIFCSPECFTASHAKMVELTEEEAGNCMSTIFTREELEAEIREAEKNVEIAQGALSYLRAKFEALPSEE